MFKRALRGQKGFTLLELLIVTSIVGVLATIAVPRFSNSVTLANTAKVQSDLRILNSAIVLHQAETGSYPTQMSDLQNYIVDLDNLRPPKGKCFLRTGESTEVTATSYTLSADKTEALCGEYSLTQFGRKE